MERLDMGQTSNSIAFQHGKIDVFKINGDDEELMLEKDMFVILITLAFFLFEASQLLFVFERVTHFKSVQLAEQP